MKPYYDCLTKEQKRISYQNNKRTRELLKVPKGYHMHHIDMNMLRDNPERYILWLPEDLMILTKAEHRAIHAKWAAQAAKEVLENVPRSEEFKEKVSQTTKKAMWTPEVREKLLLGIGSKPCICIETGEIFDNPSAVNIKYHSTHAHEVCKGFRKSINGLHFRYLEEA